MTKPNLSLWWEKSPSRTYVARRSLTQSVAADLLAPFTQFTVYYCGANFTGEVPAQTRPAFTYLITGEKEPLNVQEDSPWTRAQPVNWIGGALRTDVPEIIPVLYLTVGLQGQRAPDVLELSSDRVPLTRDASRTVRVLAGVFGQVTHTLPLQADVTLLDVVLEQGGIFSWKVPAQHRVFIYVLGGRVNFGQEVTNCRADTLIWVNGPEVYATTQCAGGRFLVAAIPQAAASVSQKPYELATLPSLDQVEN